MMQSSRGGDKLTFPLHNKDREGDLFKEIHFHKKIPEKMLIYGKKKILALKQILFTLHTFFIVIEVIIKFRYGECILMNNGCMF